MDPVDALRYLGGSATRADLLRQTTRRELDRAVSKEEVERLRRGRYSLPTLPPSVRTAKEMAGVLSHESAAAYWKMEAVATPATVHITVPPCAHRLARHNVTLHYADVDGEEATSPLRTVVDCARSLPFREALAIADSALRQALVEKDELLDAAQRLRNRGSRRALGVIAHSTPLAANPFESALRGITIESRLLGFEPQLHIDEDGLDVWVDLGDPVLRMVAEADSFTFHGKPDALERDCRRYNELVSRGWVVLRFSWHQVMFDPDWVKRVILDSYRLRLYQPGGVRGRKVRKRG